MKIMCRHVPTRALRSYAPECAIGAKNTSPNVVHEHFQYPLTLVHIMHA